MKKEILLAAGIVLVVVSLSKAEDAATKKIYDTKCAMCHGKDGKGNPAMGKMLKLDKPELLDLSLPSMAKKKKEEWSGLIAKGVKKMPAYEKNLKAAEIDALVEYIRSMVSSK